MAAAVFIELPPIRWLADLLPLSFASTLLSVSSSDKTVLSGFTQDVKPDFFVVETADERVTDHNVAVVNAAQTGI